MIIVGLSHQFTASSPQEASEWVEQIKIVLRGKETFKKISKQKINK